MHGRRQLATHNGTESRTGSQSPDPGQIKPTTPVLRQYGELPDYLKPADEKEKPAAPPSGDSKTATGAAKQEVPPGEVSSSKPAKEAAKSEAPAKIAPKLDSPSKP